MTLLNLLVQTVYLVFIYCCIYQIRADNLNNSLENSKDVSTNEDSPSNRLSEDSDFTFSALSPSDFQPKITRLYKNKKFTNGNKKESNGNYANQ
uniref:Putative secreted protein n=1 Tax=Panstrongylus lignarius TaxID=156445 RepID=A0A224XRE0_9HEMI